MEKKCNGIFISLFWSFFRNLGTVDMAQVLRAVSAPPEDLGSILRTHIVALNCHLF